MVEVRADRSASHVHFSSIDAVNGSGAAGFPPNIPTRTAYLRPMVAGSMVSSGRSCDARNPAPRSASSQTTRNSS